MVSSSHLHWDHAMALVDFPAFQSGYSLPNWTRRKQDIRLIRCPDKRSSHQFRFPLSWIIRGSRFSRSKDLFGDARARCWSIWPDTPGQVGPVFSTGQWSPLPFHWRCDLDLQRGRGESTTSGFVQWLVGVDADPEATRAQVAFLHALHQKEPELVIVPAHDEWVAASCRITSGASD